MLARREHSEGELRQKLLARDFDPGEVEAAVAALKAEGLQDDGRYAEAYVHQRVARGFGPVRIAHELRERGVTEALAEPLLAAPDWRDRVGAARRKKFGEPAPQDLEERARQTRFLEHRGFTSSQIRHALK